MEPFDRLEQALVVRGQELKPCRPTKAAFDHPASEEQHEASFDSRQRERLPHLQLNLVPSGIVGWLDHGVPLISVTCSPITCCTCATSSAKFASLWAVAGVITAVSS